MADCLPGIVAAITNDCEKAPVRGLVTNVWIGNRGDFAITPDVTNPNLITLLANESTKQFWLVSTYRQDVDAGFDAVISENLPKKFAHYFKLEPWDENADQVNNLDGMDDIVVIVEREGGSSKDDGDGAFQIYGLYFGLFTSSGTGRANDNEGVPVYEFTSREGQQEAHSKYIFFDTDYATTKALIVGLETPGV